MTIPRQCRRAHPAGPEWTGDTLQAQVTAHEQGFKYIDQNVSVSAVSAAYLLGVMCLLHWEELEKNGFDWIQKPDGSRVRYKFKPRQKVSDTSWEVLVRLRRTEHENEPNGHIRIQPLFNALLHSVDNHIIVTPELKSRIFADRKRGKALANQLHTFCRSNNITCYPMTLVNMWGWWNKMRNFHEAGFEVALLPHGYKKPLRLVYYKRYIDAYWGKWGRK